MKKHLPRDMGLKWNSCPNNRLTKDTWRQHSSHRASSRLHWFKSRTTQQWKDADGWIYFHPISQKEKCIILPFEQRCCSWTTKTYSIFVLHCYVSVYGLEHCIVLVPCSTSLATEKWGWGLTVVGLSRGVGWDIISAVKTTHKVLAVVIVKLNINEYDVSGTQRNDRGCSTKRPLTRYAWSAEDLEAPWI